MLQRQMELGLGRFNSRRAPRRATRAAAARWWFDRMRQAVDLAMDFAPTDSEAAKEPSQRPEPLRVPA